MAKALFGHVGLGSDVRLAAEVRGLRSRVAELQAELAALRSHTLSVTDDDIRLLTLDEQLVDSQPAFS